MTDALFQAVQGRRLFHLEMVRPGPGDGGEALPSGHKFTLKDLAQIRRTYGADAVLVGCISQAQPYPRTKIGLYLRLLDLKRGQLLWAVDHVWDAADDHTQRRMEAFFRREIGDGSAPFQWQLATLSPRVFQKFVAWETAETLPGRPLPETPEVDPQSLFGGNFRKNLGF